MLLRNTHILFWKTEFLCFHFLKKNFLIILSSLIYSQFQNNLYKVS